MNNGFVIFVVAKDDFRPYFLKFGDSNIYHVSDANDATVYPIYEAAEVVANTKKDDYLCIKIFDANGNPCSNGENSKGRASSDTRYIRKSSSNDDFF